MAASLQLGVQELMFAAKAPSFSRIRIRIKLPNSIVALPLETSNVNVPSSAINPLRFDWAHHVPLTKDGRSYIALQKALESARVRPGSACIEFQLIDAADGKAKAQGVIDLAALVGASSEEEDRRIYLEDATRRTIGTLKVRLQALDAVRLVSSAGGGGTAGGTAGVSEDIRRAFNRFDADGSGDIDADELHDALSVLGMSSSGTQAKAILTRYTSGGRKSMRLNEFAKLVEDLRAHTGKDPVSPQRKSPGAGLADGGIDAKVRAAFDAFDTDRTCLASTSYSHSRTHTQRICTHSLSLTHTHTLTHSLTHSRSSTDHARTFTAPSEDTQRTHTRSSPAYPNMDDTIPRSQAPTTSTRTSCAPPSRCLGYKPTRAAPSRSCAATRPVARARSTSPSSQSSSTICASSRAGGSRCSRRRGRPRALRGVIRRRCRARQDAQGISLAWTQRCAPPLDALPPYFPCTSHDDPVAATWQVRAAFEAFDADGSGGIDQDELMAALKQLGMGGVTRDQAKGVLAKYGTSNRRDGSLDIFEFDRLVRDLNNFQGGGLLATGSGPAPYDAQRVGGAKVDARVQVGHLPRSISSFHALPCPSMSVSERGDGACPFQAAFDRFDSNADRYIDQHELQGALRELGMSASAAQVKDVLRRYDDTKVDGKLDLFEFDRLYRDLSDFQQGKAPTLGSSGGGGTTDARVRAAFERFDSDRNGKIDARELREALQHLGVAADDTQARRVLARYDADRNASLDLGEFGKLVTELIEYQGGGTTPGVIPPEVRQAFAQFDRDRNGSIDAHELLDALKALGINAGESQASAILRQYDADSNKSLDVDEFARLVRDIKDFQVHNLPIYPHPPGSAPDITLASR